MNKKSLKELNLEELWQLFPIRLEPYNPLWESWGREEIGFLKDLLTDYDPDINHIGSTAIPGIMAKPIIDILVETSDSEGWKDIQEIMEAAGYILMAESGERMSFNKGYTIDEYEEKVFHIHFHINGDNAEIEFRDFLRITPSLAGDYEDLKKSLLPEFKNNRDGYTEAKTEFVCNILEMSRHGQWLPEKHITVSEALAHKLSLIEISGIGMWASEFDKNKDFLWRMSFSDDRRTAVNSLWALTHLRKTDTEWLQRVQGAIIYRLLKEQDNSKKRIFLQLLREQTFDANLPQTISLLDYCFSKINSECEPYAVRCFSLYVAFKICKGYPELTAELQEILNLLSVQSLSPGLRSALRQVKKKISRLK